MAEPSILGALRDPQFRSDTLRNLVEALNGAKRSLTVGSLGAVGDMGNTLANLVRAGAGTAYHETTGRPIPQALEYRDPARDFGTSASLGNFAEQQGWLPPQTYSMPEQAGALLGPIVAMKAPDLAQSTLRGLVSALKSEPSRNAVEGFMNGMGMKPQALPQDAALATAHRNGVDMLGLPENHTPMDRARALGFDMNEYHGTGAGEFAAFDPQKMRDNVQYGGSIYTTKDPNFASRIADSKWSGDQPTVMPLLIRGGKRFDMDAPISAVDAAGIIREAGQSARADKIAEIGKPYRNGSELFYFGIDPGMSNPARGAAINRAGFDVITGDPSVEIMGVPGKPQTAIFDPSRIRSRFAAFDPARRNESDLLASFAGAGILSPLVLEQLADPRDKKDKPRK